MTVRAASPGAGAPDPGQQIDLCLKHAEMLGAQGRFAEALEALGPGLAVDPQNPYLLHERAWVLLKLWRVDEARFTLEQLLGAHPDLASARYLLAHALLQQNKHQQAEREVDACLAAEPNNPAFLLQSAQILVAAMPERRDRRSLKRAALAQTQQALAFAASKPDVIAVAVRLQWGLGRTRAALETCKRGLAEAPQDADLLELHAGLITANTPTNGKGMMGQELAHAAEMSKLLAGDPQHRIARTALFGQLWFRLRVRIDAPMYLIAFASIGILAGFAGGTADPRNVVVWWVIAAIVGGVQWARYWVLSKCISRGFRTQIAGSGPADRARRLGEIVVLGALAATGVTAVVVASTTRDAVVVRWVVVALCMLAAASFACSLAWQLGYLTRARRMEGGVLDRDAIVRLAAHRRSQMALVVLRCFESAGLWLLFGVIHAAVGFGQSRGDAAAVMLLSTSAMVLSPLTGWFLTWLAELRARGQIKATVLVNVAAPALWSPAAGAVLAACLIVSFACGAVMAPVLPGEYDAIGQYAPKEQNAKSDTDDSGTDDSGTDDSGDETCSGTRASRLACRLDNVRELSQRPVEFPNVPDPIDLRELADLQTP
ncbi:tetratricopeptide repeat protein [Leucobacter sp. HY1908]